jgi:Tol biopolymer transport system component
VESAGDVRTPAVSPDGQLVVYRHPPQLNSVRIRVARLSDGSVLPFEINVVATRLTNVGLGRARWMPDGRRIAFLGQDALGATGVYVQDFAAGRDTSASRRPLAGFYDENAVESFDVSPDGTRVVISAWAQLFSLMEGSPVPDLFVRR